MKRSYCAIIITVLVCLFGPVAFAQGEWETYMAEVNHHPASVLVDMSFYQTAPNATKPYLVVTGPLCKKCTGEKLPFKNEIPVMDNILDRLDSALTVEKDLVGTLTCNDQRVNYYYVHDTTEIRKTLHNFYKKFYNSYKYVINIKADADWKTYRDFLYPNPSTQTWIENNKNLTQLIQSGDSLSYRRPVVFWVYFAKKDDRRGFILAVQPQGYNIDRADFVKDKAYPYQLKLSRTSGVTYGEITRMTELLSKEAQKYNGQYAGWQTRVMSKRQNKK